MSDSHYSLGFMRECAAALNPECIIHLGDMLPDGDTIRKENPGTLFYQVPGNCDMYHGHVEQPEIIVPVIGGVAFYLTHGHRHHVKSFRDFLIRDARASGASAVLYGHTHVDECYQETDGLWVMNPGSCGSKGGTVGLIELEDGHICSCRILHRNELGEHV